MNTNTLLTGIPEVDQLMHATHALALAIIERDQDDLPDGYKRIGIQTNKGGFECIVDDEYDDIGKNPCTALQVILLSALDTEDEEGEIFRLLAAHPAEKQALLDFWRMYQGEIKRPDIFISSYDWQLNSGPAAILRDLD